MSPENVRTYALANSDPTNGWPVTTSSDRRVVGILGFGPLGTTVLVLGLGVCAVALGTVLLRGAD